MSKAFTRRYRLLGLNTKALEDGLPAPQAVVAQDCRFSRGMSRREGMVRLAALGTAYKAVTYNGTNQFHSAPVDTRAWALGKQFTLELLVKLATTTGNQGIFSVGTTTPQIVVDTDSNVYRVRLWDSAGNLTTLTSSTATGTSAVGLQVVRDGAALTLRVDGASEDTDTMSATNALRTPAGDIRAGRDDGSNHGAVTVDYVRCLSVARSGHRDRLMRFPDPKARMVRADYHGDLNSAGFLMDRSRYENHMAGSNTPTEATALCHAGAVVQGIEPYVDEGGRRKVFVVAGGLAYDIEVR